MATIDLDELRKEVEIDRKNLAEKEAVIRFLEKRESKSKSIFVNFYPDSEVAAKPQLIDDTERRTLGTEVFDVIEGFGTGEFSVSGVLSLLKKKGIEVRGKNPKARISQELGKLVKQEKIVITYEGAGSVPNRYRLKDSVRIFALG